MSNEEKLRRRVEELEMKYENTGKVMGRQNLLLCINELDKENAKLRDTLEFYVKSQRSSLREDAGNMYRKAFEETK